ncbi:MAG: hypothetical protein KF862_07375 [Chitinophagaceae bacterium]|nr:hypothetical protein [Chitinophagaceae bacterium]
MQRIAATTLEKFRRCVNNASPFDTEESLIDSIKGLFAGTSKTRFGGAYHKIIELGDKLLTMHEGQSGFLSDNHFFTWAQAKPAVDYRNEHSLMVHEMEIRKMYSTSYGDFQVSGRIDGIDGRIVRDAKTKFRQVSVSEYMHSIQWKVYLDVLGLDVFYYDVFEVRRFKETTGSPLIYDCDIIPHDPIKCERYDNMESEIVTTLNQFLEYVYSKNLNGFLKPALEEEVNFF